MENPKVRWVFTLNNHKEEDFNNIKIWLLDRCKTYAMQEELGESGTKHIQGAFVLKSKCRISGLKNVVGLERAHFEGMKGTIDEAMSYCSDRAKRNGSFFGNWKKKVSKPVKIITDLFPWQEELISKLEEEPDDRKVIWITDFDGGNGKSQLAKYIIYHYDAIIVGGKCGDMFNGIHNYYEKNKEYPGIVLVMLARDSEAVSYPAIEMIKDGLFYNSKYEGKQHIFNSPHVVIFSNKHPDYKKLTMDRWNEIILSEEKKIKPVESDEED